MRRAQLRRSVVALLLVALVACDDEPVGPAPAVYDVVLGRGSAQVGAILFMIEGGAVDTVEAIGYYTATAPYSGIATQVLVVGPQLGGTLVRLRVPDGRVEYRVIARELAESGTYRLLAATDYSLALIRVLR
jgi:hypothetical protein